MSNISGQLIKNSYDYVLQSDLITGVVYRIGGSVPVNPKFTSGLTVNASFTYSDGSEFAGYVLTCDSLGNATWAPSSATTSGIFVTGGTFNYTTGTLQLVNSNGSQVTISGLTDTYVTGGTVSGTTIVFSYNDTNTFQVTGITPYNLFSSYTATTQSLILNSFTGGTFSGSTLYLINNSGATIPITGFTTGSNFTGGTVSGATNFTNGLTANTISATTYYNLPVDVFVTGGTYTSGNAIFTNNTGGTFTVTGFATGGGGGQIFYLNISQSKGTNRYLSTTASTAVEQSTGVTISAGGTSTIASFQSDELNTTLIPGGIWSFYLHSYKSNSNASFNIFVEVYKRESGGTETLLFTTDPTAVTTNSPNPSMGLSDAYFSGSPILISDSIVAVVRATNTSNQSHTVTLFSEGSQHYSYAVSTLQTQQGLTCDTLSGCSIIQTIQNNFNSYTATTNPLIYNSITGGTYSGGTLSLINNSGTTLQITGFSTLQYFVTGSTPSGMTLNNGDRWFDTTTGDELVWINDGDSSQWLQICCGGGGILVGAYLPLSGGTVTGPAQFTNGLTANIISATTYQNLPTDIRVTGVSYSNNTFTFTNNTGGTFNVLFNTVTGLTVNGGLTVTGATSSGTISATTYQNLPISGLTAGQNISITGSNGNFTITFTGTTGSNFTGGTVTGPTIFTNGLTANTISATTYLNLPTDVFVTGATYSNNTFTYTNNTGGTFNVLFNTVTGLTVNGNLTVTGSTSSGTISATTYQNLPISGLTAGQNISISGSNGNFTISVTGVTSGSNFTGGTVSGATNFTGGLTANTISATTYLNLPTDIRVTGATYSNNTFTYTNNTGGTFNVLFNTVTGLTVNGNLTVTGNTSVQGLTATTISATTYQNLPTDIRVTGATYSNNTFTYTNNTGGTFNVLFNTVTGLTVNGNLTVTGTTASGAISATTYQNLPISGLTAGQDISITGSNGNFTISFTGNTSGSFTGGTVTGPTIFTNGLTANTISATTYLNLPTDVFVTGGTYSAGTATFTNNTGGTFDVTGIVTPFTGGTVSGPTNFTGGLSANTISATTYLNLPVTPVHIKIASMSGRFTSSSLNSPNITQMYVGNSSLGWSYGDYDFNSGPDGFGNLRDIGRHTYSNVGIPLPTDILSGDKIKICGMCYVQEDGVQPLNETFYVTVSYFTCQDYVTGRRFNFTTLIPASPYLLGDTRAICFSEEITTNTTLPGCTTYLVVGMTVGNDDASEITYKFSYTLDSTQSTTAAANLFIRNCCDPAYSEVIQNNGVAVGKSFVDGDGNCWSVESETTSDITGNRALTTEYDDCVLCIDSNVCPENFIVQSCCYEGSETFTAALVGIDVGSTFVDDFGFCWSVMDTTPTPITNVVTIGTVYSSTTCESLECTDANTCPNLLFIASCCKDMGFGYTTSDILGITVTVGDVFVDTFGICWQVLSENNVGFPSLNFLNGSTNYGSLACETCITANSCEINLFYTVQNCCDETIEVVELPAQYSINLVLGLIHDTGAGCYDVLSWSDVGTPTLTGAQVLSIYSNDDGGKGCNNCIANFLNNTCIGQKQCCTSYEAQLEGLTITGYLCDGTWVLNQSVPLSTSVCMALAFNPSEGFTTSCCTFLVYNPSPTTILEVDATDCKGNNVSLSIRPLDTSSVCVNCVSKATGPWEWVACP